MACDVVVSLVYRLSPHFLNVMKHERLDVLEKAGA